MEYKLTMLVIETSCVVQWPRNLTDKTLIKRPILSSFEENDTTWDDESKDVADTDKFFE